MFLAAAVLVAVTADVGTWWLAAAMVLLAAAVHALGELWQQAGSIELGYRLAPAGTQGQYQGVFGLSQGLAGTVGPSLLTFLCLGWGQAGWIVLGLWFCVLGACMPRLAAWAETQRGRRTAAPEPAAPNPGRPGPRSATHEPTN